MKRPAILEIFLTPKIVERMVGQLGFIVPVHSYMHSGVPFKFVLVPRFAELQANRFLFSFFYCFVRSISYSGAVKNVWTRENRVSKGDNQK